MALNAVTTGHCQIHLKPGGAVTRFPSVDPGQSPDWGCGGEAPGSRRAPTFYNTKNELKTTFFLLNCSIKTKITVLPNMLLDHLSFTVVTN